MQEFELVGWIGAVTFVIAYLFLSIKILSPDKILYHALNAIGGLCLTISSDYYKDTPGFFVNLIWMCIALYSIFRVVRLGLRTKKQTTTL
ncbi:MAG: hypothetical protein FD181_678 [Prolixibacteraceae bacterium]|nr:MAG: hypothetical protein FD181_678 [Prolixibacteraceae bacterium]